LPEAARGMKDKMPFFPANAIEPRRVLILTFPGTLLLDIAGPAQVFETASVVAQARGGRRAYEIVTASLFGGSIPTDTGIALATVDRARAGVADTLLVPGGPTVWTEEGNAALLNWIREAAAAAQRVGMPRRVSAGGVRSAGGKARRDALALLR
jgi:transcriptional regulator GlxA family with amidase domain